MICPSCFREILDDTEICPVCGANVKNVTAGAAIPDQDGIPAALKPSKPPYRRSQSRNMTWRVVIAVMLIALVVGGLSTAVAMMLLSRGFEPKAAVSRFYDSLGSGNGAALADTLDLTAEQKAEVKRNLDDDQQAGTGGVWGEAAAAMAAVEKTGVSGLSFENLKARVFSEKDRATVTIVQGTARYRDADSNARRETMDDRGPVWPVLPTEFKLVKKKGDWFIASFR